MTQLTPMLQQYLEIKGQHEDTILFYRMGDFYEMFFDDAIVASKILGITLTSRNKKSDAVQVPMCGIPYHAAQNYLAKLIKAGRRVAICEQTETPSEAKGIVKREVVRIISPGVITDDLLLDDKSNNYICSLVVKETGDQRLYGASFLDVSTGEFLVGEYTDKSEGGEIILDQLTRLMPSELLISAKEKKSLESLIQQINVLIPGVCITERDSSNYHAGAAEEILYDHFGVITLDGFGCSRFSSGIIAAGTLLDYIRETQKTAIDHIEKLTPLDTNSILHIDDSSRRNLELTQTIVGGQRQGSLLSVLDHSRTPMGARLLKHNLLFPLQDKDRIVNRLDAVTFFYKNSSVRNDLRSMLEHVYDLERLNSRMILGSGNGRDMLAMKNSLASLPDIHTLLEQCNTRKLIDIREQLDTLTDLHELLEKSVHHEAPVTLRDGHLIKSGYNEELDELVLLLRDGKQLILELESKERAATGIAKLKIGFNKVFGYFIEVSKLQADKVPDSYIRKQTLVNAERFITPELKEFENKVLGAQDRRVELEYQLFISIRAQLAENSSRFLKTAQLLAQIDFLSANGEMAHKFNYRRPEINDGDEIRIVEGRHPVIERTLPSGKFVPNDVHLDQTSDEVLIITGPNMAGKSTVLRQTALIVLMAQMGCYVPAHEAAIGIVDRIFTRVGAMDDLRRGQSTFMVEMSETANILNNATEKSLVILDEIGRGTSTYDGLSIAWAVAEDLVQKNGKGVKTLFATHYHELTELAKTNKRVKNYSIAVREWQSTIIFLHKLVKGGTNRSYGIQVAGLAGVPDIVVQRAGVILREIELGKFGKTTDPLFSRKKSSKTKKHPDQLTLFPQPSDPIREYLQEIDLDQCAPLDALNTLYALKEMLKN
ncbi:MAG: DNA mismatch repair protein MutS [Desulfobulbaceae bacterium]|nr:DNA mismatch repair protein MutS [Desulfobulbaceae bacterium]